MDFNDTPEEAAFRQRAQTFLAAHVQPRAGQTESLQKRLSDKEYMLAAKAYQKAKAENGFAGITWPKEQGGQGLAPIFSS